MADTSLKSIMDQNADMLAARRFADTLLHMLHDHICDASRREAWDILAKAAYEQKFELTTLAMRNEYLAWKRVNLDLLSLNVVEKSDG